VGEAIKSVYFMNDGMCSVLTVQPDGQSVEVGLIGKEGFVGLPVIFGFKTSALRIITQGMGPRIAQTWRFLETFCPSVPL
jgi:CRP-like cAMP-binding protein